MNGLWEDQLTVDVGRARYEGANIRTWIGFKHFVYLMEEAVLEYFRRCRLGPATLYHDYGVGLEFVESSVQLPATLGIDDRVVATVAPRRFEPSRGAEFSVKLTTERRGAVVTVLTGRARVALVREKNAPGSGPLPAALEPLTVPDVACVSHGHTSHRDGVRADQGSAPSVPRPHAFLWSWRVPYYYCHFSERLQHSGYVRAMEAVVDRFLDARGISIKTMLEQRGWIPVVSRARVLLLTDVHMEEIVHTTFEVEEIIKNLMYRARMDSYVLRRGQFSRTATGSILHGYALSRGDQAGQLAELDEATQAALLGGAA